MSITVADINLTEQLEVIRRYTNMSDPGWLYPVKYAWEGIKDVAFLLTIVFTMGIVYMRTDSPAALGFVTLFYICLIAVWVSPLGLKIAYIIAVLSIATMFYMLFGKR